MRAMPIVEGEGGFSSETAKVVKWVDCVVISYCLAPTVLFFIEGEDAGIDVLICKGVVVLALEDLVGGGGLGSDR